MKKFLYSLLVVFIPVLLSGCAKSSNQDTSLFQTFLVYPFERAIHYTALFFNGNFGVGIILITLVIRLLLLPLMLKQQKNQVFLKTKMDRLKPEMDEIQSRLKTEKDRKKQQEIQKELMELYQKHGVNPLAMGCLPVIIQMPILMGFYYAIRGSEEIATHSFLWFSLGQPDMFITFIAGGVYLIQSKLSLSSMPTQQQNQAKLLGYLSPIMIVLFSLKAPAALPLYWTVGGIFLIFQSALGKRLYPPVKDVTLPLKPSKNT